MPHQTVNSWEFTSWSHVQKMLSKSRKGKFIQISLCASPRYRDIIYILQNLQAPPELSKTKARSVRLKSSKFCIINSYLYWKDRGGILLNCLSEEEAKKKIKEFHSEDCGGHLYWKTTNHKILRAGFYWAILFADT